MVSEIRKKRKLFGLSQEQLAKILGISRQSLFSIEKGLSKPSLDLLAKLESFFETSWDNLFPEIALRKKYSNLKTNFSKEDFMRKDFFEDLEFGPYFNFNPQQIWQKISAFPRINLSDEGDSFKLEADLPGFSKDEVSLEAKENSLTVRGKREMEKQTEKKNYFYHEASTANVERTISLPEAIDVEKVKAELKDGRLVALLPKLSPRTKGKIIKPE